MKIIDDLINENIIIAFIDTSALDPMYNNFKDMSDVFNALKKHVEASKIILLTHEIVVNEIKSHIISEYSEQFDKLNKLQQSKQLYLLEKLKKYEALFSHFDVNQAVSDCFKVFKDLLRELKIQILTVGRISVKHLLDEYFSNKPPFGKKDKKSEFPDAIMLQTLKNLLNENEKIHIIAKDNDWDSVCKVNPQFVLHKTLSSLLDYVNKDNVVSTEIKNFLMLEETKKEIISIEKKILENLNYKTDGRNYDRKGLVDGYQYEEIDVVDITDIEYSLHTIEDINCDEDINNSNISTCLVILGSARLIIKGKYFDEANSMWDSETKEYMFKKFGNVIEEHELLFPIRLKISGNYREKLNIDDYKLLESDHDISTLDKISLIQRRYINDFDEDAFVVDKILQCPCCKKDIHVDLMSGDTNCVGTYERQMGLEHEYYVNVYGFCPHCKQEYEITGTIWEYPEHVCNLEQNIEIKAKEENL